MKTVVLLIAHIDYHPIEYGVTKDILQTAGIKVITASNKAGAATAKDKSTTNVDMTIDHIDPSKIDALYIIGGPGALEHLDNKKTYSLLENVAALKKPYGAICISPRILAHAHVLSGKKATGWDKDLELQGVFDAHGVTYVKKPVVKDGLVITATGPSAAEEFGNEIVKAIK